jgi:hypothetical protein
MERDDVWVVQAGDRLRLALEARAALWIGTDFTPENLERDAAVQASVARLVDFAHSAGADEGLDLVGTEASAG